MLLLLVKVTNKQIVSIKNIASSYIFMYTLKNINIEQIS